MPSAKNGYYVTLVTLWRECLFSQTERREMEVNALGKIARECWGEIPSHFPQEGVEAFGGMPNPMHGIIIIHDDPGRGAIHRSRQGILRPYEEHIVRDKADYETIAVSILDNPSTSPWGGRYCRYGYGQVVCACPTFWLLFPLVILRISDRP